MKTHRNTQQDQTTITTEKEVQTMTQEAQVIVKDQTTVVADGKEYKFDSKSAMFKWLYDNHNFTIGEIAKMAGVRYQFVYGILDNHTGGNIRKSSAGGTSKSELFRQDYDAGMTVGQIAKKHNSNYTFVFTVIKKYKLQKEVKKAREIING